MINKINGQKSWYKYISNILSIFVAIKARTLLIRNKPPQIDQRWVSDYSITHYIHGNSLLFMRNTLDLLLENGSSAPGPSSVFIRCITMWLFSISYIKQIVNLTPFSLPFCTRFSVVLVSEKYLPLSEYRGAFLSWIKGLHWIVEIKLRQV